ncbi:unnamed protein product [Rotaria socialis]
MTNHTSMDSNLNDENIDQYLSRSESTDAVGQPCTNEYPTSVTDLVVGKFSQTIDVISEIIKDDNRLIISTNGHLRTDADETSIVEEETITNSDQYQSSAEPLPSLPDPAQTQLSSVTTANSQQKLQKNRHIMISYSHGTCDKISEKIDKTLQDKGYRVWQDIRCLHGSIIGSMAKAVENSSIVLLPTNHQYQDSHYCMMEIESMNEIENQTTNTPASSTETNINSLNTIMGSSRTNDNTLDMGDRINKIISDYKNSIQKNHLQLRHLTKNELCKLMERLCQEISPDILELFRNEHFNDDNNTADNNKQDLSAATQSLSVVTQALLNQNEQIFQQIQAQQQQQLTQVLIWQQQQQQQANNRNTQAPASNIQSANNFNQNSLQIDQSDKQKDYFDTLVKLASTTILLWTMVTLVKRS